VTNLLDTNVLPETATAKVDGLTVVTRNAKDFERSGVQVLNPFGD
jgi:hypothetical protein